MLSVIMLSVIKLSVIMLNVIMMSVNMLSEMLSVIMLSVIRLNIIVLRDFMHIVITLTNNILSFFVLKRHYAQCHRADSRGTSNEQSTIKEKKIFFCFVK
jgi:hypothetical protein